MWRKIMLVLLMFSWSGLTFAEMSIGLQYEIMDDCVGKSLQSRQKVIRICACMLQEAKENGWGPDIDSDEDFREDQEKFMQNFSESKKDCEKEVASEK